MSLITVSIKNLVDAVRDTDAFTMPEMNGGTAYLYNTVYRRMSAGHDVKLSELNFDAFEQDDVDTLNDLHSDVFERNSHANHGLTCTLRSIAPESKAVAYV